MSFYRFCQYLVRTVAPLFGGLEVRGKENVPTSGPFFLLANHQSTLDPVLIQTACPRPIHTMAKSTQFTNKPLAQIMFLLHSYPVRRYQVDPQAVRYTLRIIERGEPVGIYIEGERTWDGRLQEPRPGTARLILKAGAPVVPCTIDGSFDAWPRWDSKPQRGRVTVTFGKPLHFPKIDQKRERERALPETLDTIMRAIASPLPEERQETGG